jgi:predicted nucleic acid-binding protein
LTSASLVCIDASLAVTWVIHERFTRSALSIRRNWANSTVQLIAPPIFRPEVTSAIRKAVHRRLVSPQDGRRALQRALSWEVFVTQDSDDLQREAYDIATAFDRPSAYDAQYLAVAQAAGCEFWTADKRLTNALQGRLPWVQWIGDYSST